MAAKGTQAKVDITNKILKCFENSFVYDKEIRILVVENGETIQIKCVLTCAKVNVASGGDAAIPTKENVVNNSELTEQEKQETADLLASLNL